MNVSYKYIIKQMHDFFWVIVNDIVELKFIIYK